MNPYEIELRKIYSKNINFKKKLLFIHVPKCGGNFVKRVVGGFSGDSHSKCSDFPDKILTSFFCFSFVRNPWSRVVSAYNYLLKGGNNSNHDLQSRENYLMKYSSFDSFVKEGGLERANLMQLHFLDQSYFLDRDIDYVGKIENLKKDSLLLSNIFGDNPDLRSFDPGVYYKYRSFYNTKTVDIVSKIYSEDIAKYNYDFI